jgi:tyrosinase
MELCFSCLASFALVLGCAADPEDDAGEATAAAVRNSIRHPRDASDDAASDPNDAAANGGKNCSCDDYHIRVRKNVKDLSPRERRAFVNAILWMKNARSPHDPSLSYYDQFVAWHLALYPCDPGSSNHMMMGHGGPMFLPWHRQFLLLFEDAVRTVADPDFTIPYWDWTDSKSTAAVFRDDFMGGDGDPNQGYAVTTGPFRMGKYHLAVQPFGFPWSLSASDHLIRHFGSNPLAPALPGSDEVKALLAVPTYDVAPWNPSADFGQSFRNHLEGWVGATGMTCQALPGGGGIMTPETGPDSHPILHNAVRLWAGGVLPSAPDAPLFGTMALPTAPNDPLYFLHHANIDRIWNEWQKTHGLHSYEPRGEMPSNNADDTMMPFDSIGTLATPDSVADIKALGYRYQ